MKDYGKVKIAVPAAVQEILDRLKQHGYEAYIVGGCVRDVLLGRDPKDWDITTSALPAEVKSLFYNTVDTGIQHGTVMVIKHGNGYEVTTYRVDGEYKDSRHPETVTFTRSLAEDLKRRDFTINAFAWDADGLVDLFDGLSDLENGVIRCVGDPRERFREDALRIMRAVRFAAQLGFSIETETAGMIRVYAPNLAAISVERIRVEWEKTLVSPNPCMVNAYAEYGLAQYILQDLSGKCFDTGKNNLLERIRSRCEEGGELQRRLLMAAFFENLDPEECDRAFRLLKYDNVTRKAVVNILRYKDIRIPADRLQIKQALNRMGEETFAEVLELQDISGMYPEEEIGQIRRTLQEVLDSGEPWKLSQLAVNGSDLITAGVGPGKKIGEILEKILQKVMQSPTLNVKEKLCSSEFLAEVENERKRSI